MASKKLKAIYQLKIILEDSKPPIWRRVLVNSEIKLSKLHDVIQIVMGWEGYHLHQFDDQRNFYGVPHPSYDFDIEDERKVKLSQLLASEKDKLIYEYDFGDSWRHILLLEKILSPDAAVTYPVCVAGKRASPPEDSGGIWRYEFMLEVLEDKNHPEHASLVEWIGDDDFDPAAFDLNAVNEGLREAFK